MSVNATSLGGLLQTLNTIPNVGGGGVPVQQYAATMQKVLTTEMTSIPSNQISTLNATSSALTSVQTALQQLQTATQSLASASTWSGSKVTSSNPTTFSVTSGSGAPVGNFSVGVSQLAQYQVDVATIGQSTGTGASTFTGGTFYIASAATSTAIAITVTANESLSNIVSSINAETSTTNVQAFILGNNQLAFESTQSGTSNGFTLTDATGSNFISTQAAVTMTQAAADAQISLSGVTVTSASNTFANLVPGVSLTVLATGTGQLNVQSDTSATVKAVQNWMSAYNHVIDVVHSDTQYVPASGTSGPSVGTLMGDPSAMGLLAQLPNAVNQALPGTGTIQSLSAIGIVMDPNTGHLEFQSSAGFQINGKTVGANLQDGQTVFQNALQSNSAGVQALFGVVQGTTLQTVIPQSGVLGNVNNSLNQYLGFGFDTGILTNEQNSIKSQVNSLDQYLNQLNQMIASRVDAFTSQLNSLNASLSKSQSQMQTMNALLGSMSSSSSGGSSGSSSSSTGG